MVEGAVKLIYRSIYPKQEGRVFHDIDSLNAAIRVALEIPFCGRDYSRREQFEEIERSSLRSLNPIRYQVKKQASVTVMKNGHVHLSEDAHYYSVPYKFIGKKVKLLYNQDLVEVYLRYDKIATHKRVYARFRYTTNVEHLAPNARSYTDWNPDKFIQEATLIHNDVGIYIKKELEEKSHPEQAYKSCSVILTFARRVGHKRLINACKWADSNGLYNYSAIERILNNRQDELPLEEARDANPNTPSHDNIRGKDYYS